MSGSFRVTTLAVAAILCATSSHVVFSAPSASIEQVRNGQATATTTPVPTWGTGNAGASNSHYLESHSIAYRAFLDGLPTDGTVVELVIGYDVKRSGSYAIDYLTLYQRLLPHVLFAHRDPEVFDPLSGITGVGPEVTTAAIPLPTQNLVVDPDGAESDPAAAQPLTSMASLPDGERVMTMFGGTLIDVAYVTEANVALATKSSESQVRVRFVPNGPRAVLAWGGHIACRWDWGFNADGSPRSAGGISGSSYHMRLVGWNLGSLGSMDRSMSTDAVFPVPRCGISNQGPFCAGSTNTHSAPDGMETYAWSLFDNTSGAVIVGSATGTSVTVQTSSAGTYGLLLTTGASGFKKECQTLVTVNAPVTADAGPDAASCAASPRVQLAGLVTGGAASWSGGTGALSPGRSDPLALYTPSAAEVAAGGVTLTLTSSDPAGPCPPVSDQVTITIDPVTIVNAGPDQVVCASNPRAQLQGSVTGVVSGGTWSGGAGMFSPSASALNATYTPTASEIAAGSVTLTLTSAVSGRPCPPASDRMTILINPVATVNAGPDQVTCAATPAVQLAGSVGGSATGGTWSGGGGTFVPNASTLNATYTPTPGEVLARGVTLALTTNDPAGPCGPGSDQMRITYDQPTVSVPDRVVCSGVTPATLCANAGNGVPPYSYRWSNGATTQCIAVSDTGRYSVTVTDAKGCVAVGAGAFRYRECIGMLAHTSTTCDSYQAGTGDELRSSDVHYGLQNGIISTISPGVFFYFTKVTAPSADFTIVIQQTRSNPAFPYCELQQGQIALYDADCNRIGDGAETSPGQAAVDLHGARPGQGFIVSVKYSLKSLIGTPFDPAHGVRYDFRTWIDGNVVDFDPDGLVLGTPSVTGVDDPATDEGTPELYRPTPNPFTNRMSLAYRVATPMDEVNIRVYDVAGRLVRVLASGPQAAGIHVARWDGRDTQGAAVRKGLYFVRARVGGLERRAQVTFVT